MTEFAALKAKIYSYLVGDGAEKKQAKDTKKCVIKRELKSKDLKIVQRQLDFKIK